MVMPLYTRKGFLIVLSQKLRQMDSQGSKNWLSVKVCEVETDPSQTTFTT